jgi:cytochrome c peroxidase
MLRGPGIYWALVLTCVVATGAVTTRGQASASLKSISVPKPSNLGRYVRDESALVVLGKALFWDMQLSSDGRVACASCHFHAGADHRLQNQLSSAKELLAVDSVLKPQDFPFGRGAMAAGHRVASAGVFPRRFAGVGREGVPDEGAPLDSPAHRSLRPANVRQVDSRNAPSVINAVYYFRNFWDGRASNVFTGWTPFGESDTRANVLAEEAGRLVAQHLRIENAGLASQAVEPPLNHREMSYDGRTWPMVGKKMLSAHPLASQKVAPDDSVLGRFANRAGRGLASDHTYLSLIRATFQPQYWRSSHLVHASGEVLAPNLSTGPAFTQAEYNFALFFGLAIQAYESTLASNDSPYDRYLDGNRDALSGVQKTGLAMFRQRDCASCHVDPELTLATHSGVRGNGGHRGLGPDAGFFNTGVEPIDNDIGLGGTDPFGNLLSATARNRASAARWMQGMFKTPSLRNVELTGPYFHTGSKATLEQVIDFYTSGGDYSTPSLRAWGPQPYERIAMPLLLKAFTDDRVRFERAPFDHPELCVSIGYENDGGNATVGPQASPRRMTERWASIPPTGASGNAVPLQTFDELLRGIGRDGSRAHNLATACSSR